MKRTKLSNAAKLSFVGTTYVCHVHDIDNQNRLILFEKQEKMCNKERGFEDGTMFKVPRSFDFFIKAAGEVNSDYSKITKLALYKTLKNADSESKSRSQLSKLIMQEVMDLTIEDHGIDDDAESIEDIVAQVKQVQLLRSHIIFPFENEIVQVVTETRSVLYETASMD